MNWSMDRTSAWATPVARIMFAGLFPQLWVHEAMNPEVAQKLIAGKGVPMIGVLLALAIAIEFVASIAIVVVYQTRWAGLLLFF